MFSLSSMKAMERRPKVTVLHTNDTHSRIDPFPENHKSYPNQGGVSRRMSMINAIREQEEQVLLLDAGDIFQGTPYFNVYKGEPELKLMSAMGYDAATMGNHDFDGGLEGFLDVLPHAGFPFLCANYDFKNTPIEGKTISHTVFQKGSIKVGVFGVGVELHGLVPANLYGATKYIDPVKVANEQATILRNDYHCELVICLSHLGYNPRHNRMCDKVLAAETENIDLIIGGHTHTFMAEPEAAKNKAGKPVLINQVGWAGLVLGRIDFYFDEKGEPDLWATVRRSSNYLIA